MKTTGFNTIEFFYYKNMEKVSFLLKYGMEPSLVEERDHLPYKQEEYEKVSRFTDTLIAVGRKNGLIILYTKKKSSAPTNEWIKLVCNCYRPSRQDAPHLRLTVDDECSIVFIIY